MIGEDGKVIHKGLASTVGRSMGVFYMDNGLIGSRELEWIQGSCTVLIGLFHRISLIEKSFQF